MDKLRDYEVNFSGLNTGKHTFQFEIGKSFFQLFDTEQEFSNPRIIADVLLDKHSTFLEFEISIHGVVELICDISNVSFDQSIENFIKVLVKFGEEYDDSHEEVITIPSSDYAFNISQLVYENVMLAIPMKKLSPDLSDDDLEVLEQFSPKIIEEVEEDQTNDPRWEALKRLKDKN